MCEPACEKLSSHAHSESIQEEFDRASFRVHWYNVALRPCHVLAQGMMAQQRVVRLPAGVASSVHATYVVPSLSAAAFELVLNSVDAGASQCAVAISWSTFTVRVEDDGCGISSSDMRLVGERHATSKHGVGSSTTTGGSAGPAPPTYGSRGLSLYSIAQVSTLEISSASAHTPPLLPHAGAYDGRNAHSGGSSASHRSAAAGAGGVGAQPVGLAAASDGSALAIGKVFSGGTCLHMGAVTPSVTCGTAVVARDLFSSQPVRRRAMSKRGELDRLLASLLRLAVMHADTAFSLWDEEAGRHLLFLPRAASMLARLADIYGAGAVGALLPVGGASDDGRVRVVGYVAVNAPTRALQLLYINGRSCRRIPLASVLEAAARKGPGRRVIRHSDAGEPTRAAATEWRTGVAASVDSERSDGVEGHLAYVMNVILPASDVDVVQDGDRTLVDFKDGAGVQLVLATAVRATLGLPLADADLAPFRCVATTAPAPGADSGAGTAADELLGYDDVLRLGASAGASPSAAASACGVPACTVDAIARHALAGIDDTVTAGLQASGDWHGTFEHYSLHSEVAALESAGSTSRVAWMSAAAPSNESVECGERARDAAFLNRAQLIPEFAAAAGPSLPDHLMFAHEEAPLPRRSTSASGTPRISCEPDTGARARPPALTSPNITIFIIPRGGTARQGSGRPVLSPVVGVGGGGGSASASLNSTGASGSSRRDTRRLRRTPTYGTIAALISGGRLQHQSPSAPAFDRGQAPYVSPAAFLSPTPRGHASAAGCDSEPVGTVSRVTTWVSPYFVALGNTSAPNASTHQSGTTSAAAGVAPAAAGAATRAATGSATQHLETYTPRVGAAAGIKAAGGNVAPAAMMRNGRGNAATFARLASTRLSLAVDELLDQLPARKRPALPLRESRVLNHSRITEGVADAAVDDACISCTECVDATHHAHHTELRAVRSAQPLLPAAYDSAEAMLAAMLAAHSDSTVAAAPDPAAAAASGPPAVVTASAATQLLRKQQALGVVSRKTLARMRAIGQLDKEFILCVADAELGGSAGSELAVDQQLPLLRQLLIVDQHAADERVRLEIIEAAVFGGAERVLVSADGLGLSVLDEASCENPVDAAARAVARYMNQVVLPAPVRLTTTPQERHVLRTHAAMLAAWGFDVRVPDEAAVAAGRRSEAPASAAPTGTAQAWEPPRGASSVAEAHHSALFESPAAGSTLRRSSPAWPQRRDLAGKPAARATSPAVHASAAKGHSTPHPSYLEAASPTLSAARSEGAATVTIHATPALFGSALTSADLREFVALLHQQPHLAAAAAAAATTRAVAGAPAGACDVADAPSRDALRWTALPGLYAAGARPPAVTRALHSKACRGAVMFGDPLSLPECARLLRLLTTCRLPFQCAHGRPSVLPLVTLAEAPTVRRRAAAVAAEVPEAGW
jgi:DNA mismatch repair ATPase MutL